MDKSYQTELGLRLHLLKGLVPHVADAVRRRDKLTSDSYAGETTRKGKLGGGCCCRPRVCLAPWLRASATLNVAPLCGADAITSGVPVSVLDDEYTQATLNLGSTIQQYAAIDLYNPERAKVWLSL